MNQQTEARLEISITRDRAYGRRLAYAASRRTRVTFLAFAALIAGGGLLILPSDGWAPFVGIIDVAIGGGLGLSTLVAVPRAVRRLPDTWFEPRTYVFTEDHFASFSPSMSTQISWRLVGKVIETRLAFLLVPARGGQLKWDIPRAGLTAEQEQQLRWFFARVQAPSANR